jgi:hypothetical protein
MRLEGWVGACVGEDIVLSMDTTNLNCQSDLFTGHSICIFPTRIFLTHTANTNSLLLSSGNLASPFVRL